MCHTFTTTNQITKKPKSPKGDALEKPPIKAQGKVNKNNSLPKIQFLNEIIFDKDTRK